MVELAHRESDGVAVSLLWSRDTNELTVSVNDRKTADAFELRVANDRGLDAFYHPYAYAAAA
jgi:hypothetical protein